MKILGMPVRVISITKHEIVVILMFGPERVAGVNDGITGGAGVQQSELFSPFGACRVTDHVERRTRRHGYRAVVVNELDCGIGIHSNSYACRNISIVVCPRHDSPHPYVRVSPVTDGDGSDVCSVTDRREKQDGQAWLTPQRFVLFSLVDLVGFDF